MALLEEVFKVSGVPSYTFVKPIEYSKLMLSLRTPGRGLVVEGPSGIGKTTSVTKALNDLGLSGNILSLSARKKDDCELIRHLPGMKGNGIVTIDDFHYLDQYAKQEIADYMKILADEEDSTSKIILIGINKAGDQLVKFSPDLNNRIDTIRFEANPEEKVCELIQKGEHELCIELNTKESIVKESHGSFHIAQMLCQWTCLLSDVLESCSPCKTVEISIEIVKERVIEDLSRVFFELARTFATGPRLRREGRAPYLHLLYWIATSNEWCLQLDQAMAQHPDQRTSVNQIVEQGYLSSFIESNERFAAVLHYDKNTRLLSIEDPKFVYYIRNLLWNNFARQVGFIGIDFSTKYDFALSFAGSERELAEKIFTALGEHEVAVFYDKNEQSRILAESVEDYLGPIYRSEAGYVIALLSSSYPTRIWTKFESEHFKSRFGDGSIIPIWFDNNPPGIFDKSAEVGGYMFRVMDDHDKQVEEIVKLLIEKLHNHRYS